MKYAIVKIAGSQYKVAEGDEILVNKITGDLEVEVLLVANDGDVNVGTPTVKDAKITAKIVDPEVKGKKVTAATFKAKARIRKKVGIRPRYSRVKIEKITV